MDEFFNRAIANITRHGDTDVFPFPFENHVMFDKPIEVIDILRKMSGDVRAALAKDPPQNTGALAPAGYTGFRWATQIDPIWNAAYLAWVLSIADEIEAARIPVADARVFSYRYKWDENEKTIFDKGIGWRSFIEKAVEKANVRQFVVSCDISEFYLRINHHRLENALNHLPGGMPIAQKIQPFLSNFSRTYSFGLPVGGPASRLLSELVLNQIDRLLLANEIDFIRFVDDYYLFADSPAEAFHGLVALTRFLIENQGLQLQKSKTRVMSSAEFVASSPLVHDDDEGAQVPLGAARQAIMAINLHYDPYSSTAAEDYNRLQTELDRFPILDLLKSELKKSRVNISLSKRLVSLLKYLRDEVLEDAILTVVKNEELLYPIYYNVLLAARSVWPKLQKSARESIIEHVSGLIENRSRVMEVDLNLHYAVRLLSLERNDRSLLILNRLFRSPKSEFLGADIIVTFFNWRDWHWLSDFKNRVRHAPANQRRAFIVASFLLGDEGDKWRKHMRREFSEEELLVRDWAESKQGIAGWTIPT